MKQEAANTIIPFNLYLTFRRFAEQRGHPLHGNERWLPYVEALVARQAPNRSGPAMDLARWHDRHAASKIVTFCRILRLI